jgi:hypothetical protein
MLEGSMLNQSLVIPQKVDGFSYNAQLLYLPERYFPNALAELDILRRANNYRPRWFTIPDDIGVPIQPFDTYYYQCEVADGSYLWGYQFSSVSATDPNGTPAVTTASDICIQATDSCTGIPLFLDFANGFGCHANFTSGAVPVLLSRPRLVLTPGLVNIEIANRTANSITCQLLLMFAEPCRLIDEAMLERGIR